MSGFDFEGGHLEEHGLSAEGELVDVPLHRHHVSLDFTRLELDYSHTFRTNLDLWFRLPYEVKHRTGSIELLEPASTSEVAAMEKNREVHHADRSLAGLSDIELFVAHRWLKLLQDGDGLDLALGVSLPTGATEEDPFAAGDAGLQHEHIQFGTGTFDPLLEIYYSTPLNPAVTFGLFGIGRASLYENRKGFEGSPEATIGVTALYEVKRSLTLQATLTAYQQGFAYWNGARDVNSGLRSFGGTVGMTFVTKRGTSFNFSVGEPIAQETLDATGDTFEYGPSFLFHVSKWFRKRASSQP